MKAWKLYVLFFIISLTLLFATLNFHRQSKIFDYNSEIFADKAGYYVYLPAVFIHNFDANSFPDSVDIKTGYGFKLDNNKVITKYPSGVALLQSPFFISIQIYNAFNNIKSNGFEIIYHKMIDIAAIFYFLIAIFYLFKFLRNYFDDKVIILSLFLIIFGTNLYYYAVVETGHSHIYSFFLFSIFLYNYKKYISDKTIYRKIVMVIIFGLIFLVRPINILLIFPLFFLDFSNWKEFINRFKLEIKQAILLIILFFIIISPQLLYNKYLSNSLFHYSYGEESFIYLFSPKIIKVLFAFENGLITYNPIHLLIILFSIIMVNKGYRNAWIVIIIYALITFTYASWWSTQLGCGFGHRGYVEFYALFSISLSYLINFIFLQTNKILKYTLFAIIILCVLYNMKLIYTFDNCWFGQSSWDIDEFNKLLFSPTK